MTDLHEQLCGELYQIIGSLADDFGILEHPMIEAVMDELSDPQGNHLLPWPSKSPDEWRNESSGETVGR